MNRKELATKLKSKGLTYNEIGKKFGVSRQRIFQIVNGLNVSKDLRNVRRNKIRERDNNTCQKCGAEWDGISIKFPVHHIDCDSKKTKQVDKLEIEEKNLITLCFSCHRNIHSKIKHPTLKNPERKEYYRKYYFNVKKKKREIIKNTRRSFSNRLTRSLPTVS